MTAEPDHDPSREPVTAHEPARRSGSIVLVLVVAAGIVATAVALTAIGRAEAQPFILGLLALLAMVGLFNLFAFAAGIIRFADRAADSSATPVHSTNAPKISQNLSVALAIGTARTRAKTRFVVSSGSTNASDRFPIDQAARIWPPIMQPMPVSQRGWRSRSVISRSDRKRESGSRCAACC